MRKDVYHEGSVYITDSETDLGAMENLQELPNYIMLGPHSWKNGDNVTGKYELMGQYALFAIRGNNCWCEPVSIEKAKTYTTHRVVAVPLSEDEINYKQSLFESDQMKFLGEYSGLQRSTIEQSFKWVIEAMRAYHKHLMKDLYVEKDAVNDPPAGPVNCYFVIMEDKEGLKFGDYIEYNDGWRHSHLPGCKVLVWLSPAPSSKEKHR